MHFTCLYLLPLPLLILSHPVGVDHDIITSHPIQNHANSLLPFKDSYFTVKTARSVTNDEATMTVNLHTTAPHSPSNTSKRPLLSRAFSILQSLITMEDKNMLDNTGSDVSALNNMDLKSSGRKETKRNIRDGKSGSIPF